jgi:OmcA/MtrC family decaheme c-type cytochrome
MMMMGVRVMTSLNTREPVPYSRKWVPLLACAALALAACSGDRGEPGSAGSGGPVGPPGAPPGGGVPVTSAKVIKASIVSATVPEDGKPVVEVRLVNESDQPLAGLPAANISFVLARLEPVVNGKPSTWHAVTRRTETAGSVSKNQGTTEAGTKGKWVESSLKNGVYTYTFAQSLKGISDIPYDASLVHRVGLEIRTSTGALTTENIPANNAVFTWAPASGIPLAQSGREIVDNDTCNACHDNLAVHGTGRFDLQYCVMCHESYSFDAQSGNSLDLKVMIHKIHSGATLPSVVNDPDDPNDNGTYGIYGYNNEFADFSDLRYPQDKRNCQTCHQESDADTPQASNWRQTVNRETCTACHDNVNFTTGANHGGVAATEDSCTACHGPSSAVLSTQAAHVIPEQEAAKRFKFEVVRVEPIKLDGSPGATACPATAKACKVLPGEFAKVTIKVTDPATGKPYKITDAPFTNVIPCTPVPPATTCTPTAARLRARVAYTTTNFTSPGSGNTPAQPIQIDYLATTAAPAGSPAAAGGAPVLNADGSYTKAGGKPMPTGLFGGSGAVFVEGRTIVDVDESPLVTEFAEVGVTSSAGVVYPITDATPVARRPIINVQKCDDCHKRLSFHGDNRNDNTELCATCHNPEFAAGATLSAGRPYDFKLMIHAIHASTYNFGGLTLSAGYPGKLNNCEGCHLADTYYPVDPAKVFATSITRGANAASPVDDIAYTPNAAICGACHTSTAAKSHIQTSGGSFSATKKADGTSPEAQLEQCSFCHGAGKVADVKVEHGVGAFDYN